MIARSLRSRTFRCGHLTEARLQDLLQGRLDAQDERWLCQHLADGSCEQCETFLESLPPDVERQLLSVLSRAVRATDLSAQACARVLARNADRFWYRPAVWLPLAAVAALLLGVILVVALGRTEVGTGQRWKGPEIPGSSGLQLMLGLVDATAPPGTVARVASGAALPAQSVVVFRVRATDPCFLTVVHGAPGGRGELLLPESAEPLFIRAGEFTPILAGRPAGLTLREPGRHVLCAFCAARPLDDAIQDEVRRACVGGTEPAEDAGVVSLDRISVDVAQGGTGR